MTLTAIQKAELDRGILAIDLHMLEKKAADHTSSPLTIGAVESYLDTVKNTKISLFEIHAKISYQKPADMKPHEDEFKQLNERILNLKVSLSEIRKSLVGTPIPVPPPTTSHIRLPDMQLPSFDGRFEDWPSFEDLYKATVGNNRTLSSAQKLQYLKSCVKGEAANLIRSFNITDSNYVEAWTLLQSRYNNPAEIIYSLCKKILYQPHLKGESVTGLQQLLNSTMESVRSLKVLGQPIDTWDSLLVVSVVEKLDPDTRSEWAKTRTSTTPAAFHEVINFLEKHIRGLTAKGALGTKAASSTSINNKQNSAPSSKRTFHVQAAPATCCVCKGSHSLYQCSKLHEMDASSRIAAVRRTSACLNCLRDGHSVKNCKSSSVCRLCSMKHHTLLHNNQQQTNRNDSSDIPAVNSSTSSSASTNPTVRTNLASSSDSTSQKMFKTAVVEIEDSTCRVIYDDCSEVEYITERCANANP